MIVRFHGGARELVGEREVEFVLTASVNESSLRQRVYERYPQLKPFDARLRLARNDSFVLSGEQFEDGDVVDFMPPVAGGSPGVVLHAEIREGVATVDEVIKLVGHASAGAIASFSGVVRDHHAGKRVTHLEYEAQHSLADKEMKRVLQEVAREFNARIAAIHCIGSLRVGDVAVVVAASSAHREEAFAACRAAIDRIKETVPIWKKEWAEDGSADWVGFEQEDA